MVAAGMRVGEGARRTGLTVRTLRLYDEIAVVVPSARTSGDHRLYSPQDLHRLVLVQHLKSLGLSLADMKTALDDPAFEPARALGSHIAAVEQRLAETQELLGRLRLLRDASAADWQAMLEVVALSEKLRHHDPTVRIRAALDLGLSLPVAEVVTRYLSEDDEAVREVLLWTLAR